MRIYVPRCSTNGQADEEIQQVPESAKTPKTANIFWIPLMHVTLSSVTLNFELKKVVLSSCLARLLLVPVHFIESEH